MRVSLVVELAGTLDAPSLFCPRQLFSFGSIDECVAASNFFISECNRKKKREREKPDMFIPFYHVNDIHFDPLRNG